MDIMDEHEEMDSDSCPPGFLQVQPIPFTSSNADPKPNKTQQEFEDYKRQKAFEMAIISAQNQKQEVERQEALQPLKNFVRGEVDSKIIKQMQSLPIFARKEDILATVKEHQIVIIQGETGSGKSTQIPQYLADAGYAEKGRIAITQPRRVAAKSLAERVAEECGVKLGTVVGYSVRFDQCISDQTVIKYMTDGLLVKEFCNEVKHNLEGYSVIIIDEAHERRKSSDVCFGLLKRVAKAKIRPDLRIIVTSATLDAKKFSSYFDNAPILKVDGQSFDVDVIWSSVLFSNDYIQSAVNKVIEICKEEPEGDILVFLCGRDEIEQAWRLIDNLAPSKGIDNYIIHHCHGSLAFEDQQKVFEPTPKDFRKIVLATNIAETSLTIDGIVYIVDCGYFKQSEFNPKTGIETLVKQKITQAQAVQRQGRAGRTRPGKAFRFYSELDYDRFALSQTPEIQRANLESIMLDLITMGVKDLLDFEFLDPPSRDSIMDALDHLTELGAIDKNQALTDLGYKMAKYPVEPSLAKTLIESVNLHCSNEIVTIVSLLSTNYKNLFIQPHNERNQANRIKAHFSDSEGDHLSYLNVWNTWTATRYDQNWCKNNYIQHMILVETKDIREQLCGIMEKHDLKLYSCGTNKINIRKAITAGFFHRLAVKSDYRRNDYKTFAINDKERTICCMHPSSVLFPLSTPPKWVIYHEIFKTNKPYMRGVIVIERQWIQHYAPDFYRKMTLIFPEITG